MSHQNRKRGRVQTSNQMAKVFSQSMNFTRQYVQSKVDKAQSEGASLAQHYNSHRES